jgi:RNA polymerase sigma-70 factor (ECF subfamily)
MANEEDSDLVKATLEGDPSAFDELLLRHQKRIYNVIMRIAGNREDAQDAVQTAFLKAYDNLGTFDPERRFFSWVCRIGVNEALNALKRRQRSVMLAFEPPTRQPDPEQRAACSEVGHKIQEALDTLTPDYRLVVVLRHFQGLSYQEIAEIAEIPVKTVKSRLFSARLCLRDLLLREGLLQ